MPDQKQFESKSSVLNSPYFSVIMDSYDKFGRSMSAKAFWERYVIPVDPKIIYMTWTRFTKKIAQQVISRENTLLNKLIDKKVSENEMEKSSLQNILAISEATLDDLINNPELLNQIPVKERMKWLFQAMKARDSRMVALTKVNAEKRKATMWEEMMQAAQYGEIDESEFSENDPPQPMVPTPAKPLTTPPTEKPENKPEKIIEFDPDEI